MILLRYCYHPQSTKKLRLRATILAADVAFRGRISVSRATAVMFTSTSQCLSRSSCAAVLTELTLLVSPPSALLMSLHVLLPLPSDTLVPRRRCIMLECFPTFFLLSCMMVPVLINVPRHWLLLLLPTPSPVDVEGAMRLRVALPTAPVIVSVAALLRSSRLVWVGTSDRAAVSQEPVSSSSSIRLLVVHRSSSSFSDVLLQL